MSLTKSPMPFSLTYKHMMYFSDLSCSFHYHLFWVRERLNWYRWGMDTWRSCCKELLICKSAFLNKSVSCFWEVFPVSQLPFALPGFGSQQKQEVTSIPPSVASTPRAFLYHALFGQEQNFCQEPAVRLCAFLPSFSINLPF